MLHLTDILIFSFTFLWIFYLWYQRKNYILSWKLDTFWGFPIIGVLYKVIGLSDDLGIIGEMRHLKKTPAVAWLGPYSYLFVDDPVTMQKLLTTPEYNTKAYVYNVFRDFFGNGLFSNEGMRWRTHRKLFSPCFSQKVLNSFLPVFNKKANNLLKILSTNVGKSEVIMQDLIERCTMDISCENIMDNNMEIQGNNYYDSLFQAYHNGFKLMRSRMRAPWLQIKSLFKITPYFKRNQQYIKKIEKFIYPMISSKLLSKNDIKHKAATKIYNMEENRFKFIDRAVKGYLDENTEFDLKDLEEESKTMMFASYETTSSTMSFLILCLSLYPEYREKLFEELCTIFPTKDFEITSEDLSKMVYTDLVINETIRLFPAVPLIARTPNKEIIFKDDVILPKGTEIVLDIFHMQRDEKYWGSDALEFNPDHFLPENLKGKHPYSFMAFGKGPRSCIGQRYALHSLKIMTAKIFRNFYFTTETKMEDLEFEVSICLNVKSRPKFKIYSTNK